MFTTRYPIIGVDAEEIVDKAQIDGVFDRVFDAIQTVDGSETTILTNFIVPEAEAIVCLTLVRSG